MSIKISFAKLEDIKLILDLELDLYPADCVLPESDVKELFYRNNYLFIVAKDNNDKVIGVLNIMPLNNSTFSKIIDGSFDEWKDLKYENLLPLDENMNADFYCSSFATTNSNTEVASQLMLSLIKYARLLKKKNIKINRLACIAATKDGHNLCEKLGFEKLYEHEPSANGVPPAVFVLDMNKDSNSFLINKMKNIIYG